MSKGKALEILRKNFSRHDFDSYTLYVIMDGSVLESNGKKSYMLTLEEILRTGTDIVQLREKNLSTDQFYSLALKVRTLTDKYSVPLIINDRVDAAIAVDAAGVHLGQSDMDCAQARKMLGDDKIIGVTAPTVALAKKAQADGADYIGVGAMFASSTKPDVKVNTITNLKKIREAVDIPIVVIGGVKRTNIERFRGIGINGAAVISDILCDKAPFEAACEMREKAGEICVSVKKKKTNGQNK